MKRYNVVNDRKGGVKITESETGHWMLAAEVERMLEDLESKLIENLTKGNDNAN